MMENIPYELLIPAEFEESKVFHLPFLVYNGLTFRTGAIHRVFEQTFGSPLATQDGGAGHQQDPS
jgi:hypothetical protein